MKTKGKLSLTVVFLILFLGAIIALESFNNYISGADVGSLTLTLTNAPNNITLISPEDGRSISEENTIMFEYMMSSALNIINCTLILNNTAVQANSSAVIPEVTLNFSRLMHFGTYDWGVSCTSTTNVQFNSSTRSLVIASTTVPPAQIRTGNQPANPVTEILSTVAVGDIKANEIKIITGFNVKSNIDSIAISLKKFTSDVKVTAKVLFDKPPEIIEPPMGYTYSYTDISIPKILPDNILAAEIRFKVEKSWLESNNIARDSVWLARFNADKWQKLNTVFEKDSAKYNYYIAQTPGFSTFAIVADLPGTVTPEAIIGGAEKTTGSAPKTPTLFFHLPSNYKLPNPKVTTITIITLIAILTIAGVAVIAKSFESEEVQKLSSYITTARNRGNEIKAVEGVLLKYGWHPDTIKKAVWHHRLKKIQRKFQKNFLGQENR